MLDAYATMSMLVFTMSNDAAAFASTLPPPCPMTIRCLDGAPTCDTCRATDARERGRLPPWSLKQCNVCGSVHTHAEWQANPTRRLWLFPDEEAEIAECACGNTMYVTVARGPR